MNTTEPRDLVGQTVRAIEALEKVIGEFTGAFHDFLEIDWHDSSAKAGEKLDRLMVLCGKLERAVEVLSPALKSYTDVITEFVKTVRRNYDFVVSVVMIATHLRLRLSLSLLRTR